MQSVLGRTYSVLLWIGQATGLLLLAALSPAGCSSDSQPPICARNEYQCAGDVLTLCNAALTGYDKVKSCKVNTCSTEKKPYSCEEVGAGGSSGQGGSAGGSNAGAGAGGTGGAGAGAGQGGAGSGGAGAGGAGSGGAGQAGAQGTDCVLGAGKLGDCKLK